jgi:FAD:protein FMN transferase
VAAASARQHLHHYEGTRLSMACVYAIELYGPDPQTLPSIAEAAFDEVDRIDRLMSHYKPESPLSRVNREAARHPVPVDRELFDFISESLRYTKHTAGAFDVTVGPLMKAWGFFRGEGRIPLPGELDEARRHVGPDHVLLDAETTSIAFDRAGVALDLGGIAKGYAVDRAAAVLRSRGITAALISAGGSTIYAIGAPPNLAAWDVSLQDPVDPGKVARTIPLKDAALSVAGSSEKAFAIDGVRYAHIMDPRTGMPVHGMLSVAVIASSGTLGDALDDALFVLGPEHSRHYLKQWPGTEAFFFIPARDGAWTLAHEYAAR